jgi:thiol-disulfide isomerase/thioredoxin
MDMQKIESVEQYKEVIQSGKHIMMFSADWCPDCRFIEPVLPEIVDNYQDYQFYYVDRDKFIDLCAELNIFGIPSFVAYKDGKEIGRYVNKERKTKEQIEEFINSLPS